MRNNLLPIGLIAFILFTGCAGNYNLSKTQKGRLIVPAGVDSSVAVRADTLADNLFVSINQENRAKRYKALGEKSTIQSDTLWKYISNHLEPGFKVSEDDSIQAIHAFNTGAKDLQKLAQLEQKTKNNLSPEIYKNKVLKLLENARKYFEKALILNPFDLENKSWLARVYQSLAARLLDDNQHKKAVKILENLLQMEKGEYSLYARLAECYYAIENWQAAHQNFTTAETVLFKTAGLDFTAKYNTQDVSLDTSDLFYYIYYQGDTEIKMHYADRGIKNLQRALTYAATEQERVDILSYIEWINWDDGNVRAVELRDEYIALQEVENYGQAAKGFLKLVPALRTRRAIDEIIWRLSLLEYQYLDRKNEGIDRLKHVVGLTPKDKNGAPFDSTYKKYFNSYGIMSHNLGLENFTKNRKFAFMYFQQAVAIEWESRAKSYLEIAKLSRNNSKAVQESCELALREAQQLDQLEKMQVYQLMVEALKRSGQFAQARTYYARWVDLKRNKQRSSH